MKNCNKCLITKSLSEYGKNTNTYRSVCKKCTNEVNKLHYYKIKDNDERKLKKLEYRKNNKDRLKNQRQAYFQQNREKVLEQKRKSNKKWRNKNKEILAAKSRDRRKSNIEFKLAELLRSRIRYVLKYNKKPGSVIKNLGCTLSELKQHFESKFQPGMTWENQGFYGWHIDHIRPLSSFNLTNLDDFKKACHFTNLQPL